MKGREVTRRVMKGGRGDEGVGTLSSSIGEGGETKGTLADDAVEVVVVVVVVVVVDDDGGGVEGRRRRCVFVCCCCCCCCCEICCED